MSLRQYVLDLNRQRSTEFCTPAMQDRIKQYHCCHPTTILAFKCMDGRLNLPVIARMPFGVIQPFRNIGGKFDLGSNYLGRLVYDAKETALREGHQLLALCTYHFSRGEKIRGCAGHNHDTTAARASAFALKDQFGRVFGETNALVTAVCVGIETDEDALVFHDGGDRVYAIAEHIGATDEAVAEALAGLYPDMSPQVRNDLLPLALGNRDHIRQVRASKRPIAELVHGENIIGVGRGFSFLHLPNKALIIGPYDHNWTDAVRVAGNIVSENLRAGRVPVDEGVLLLTLAPFWELGERMLAVEKARLLSRVSSAVLREHFPDLQVDKLVGLTDMRTWLIEEISEN